MIIYISSFSFLITQRFEDQRPDGSGVKFLNRKSARTGGYKCHLINNRKLTRLGGYECHLINNRKSTKTGEYECHLINNRKINQNR